MKKVNILIHGPSAILLLLLLASCHPKAGPAVMTESPKAALTLSDAQMQLANIRVEEVTKGSLGHRLLLTGVLKIDEESVISISAGIAGRIEKLYFKNTGETVKEGDPLYDFYSEEMLALQREYKSLEDNNWNFLGKSDKTALVENKLLLLGMLPSQIADLKKGRKLSSLITVYSSRRGIVRSLNVTEGDYVEAGRRIYELADDSRIWAEAQVYPNELQFLSVGMPAEVIVPIAGDLHIPNRISFINPAFEPGSNVTLVRAIISNPGKLLHPGMHALISVQTNESSGIIIPASAILVGKEGSLVWIRNEDGSFTSRTIETGMQSSDSVLVLSGLEETEKIVTSGVYLLNSEKILNQDAQEVPETGVKSAEKL